MVSYSVHLTKASIRRVDGTVVEQVSRPGFHTLVAPKRTEALRPGS